MKPFVVARFARPAIPIAILAASLLSGCATELTFRRRASLDFFVGKDRSEVVALLGEPTSISREDGKELLVYDRSVKKWVSGEPDARNELFVTLAPWVYDSRCETTFRLAGGRVEAWRLNGNDCRNQPFPPMGATIADALEQVEEHGVDQVATYQHSPYTARSVVDYGQFYSN
jgi:hypothetical protein